MDGLIWSVEYIKKIRFSDESYIGVGPAKKHYIFHWPGSAHRIAQDAL